MGVRASLTRPEAEAATGTRGVSPYVPSRQSWGGCPSSLELQHACQRCATLEPGLGTVPGTPAPEPATAWQTCAVGKCWQPQEPRRDYTSQAPVRREVPLPLCLDPSGDAFGHLFCPFLSLSGIVITPLDSLFMCLFSVCRVNF